MKAIEVSLQWVTFEGDTVSEVLRAAAEWLEDEDLELEEAVPIRLDEKEKMGEVKYLCSVGGRWTPSSPGDADTFEAATSGYMRVGCVPDSQAAELTVTSTTEKELACCVR